VAFFGHSTFWSIPVAWLRQIGGVEKAYIAKKQKMAHIPPESEKVVFMNHRSKKFF